MWFSVTSVCGGNQVRQVCLAYSQAWWWECHGLALHEFIGGIMNVNMYYVGVEIFSHLTIRFQNDS